jgi:ubiquinone/menaquinone biosynthesis C-methylase UbiE
LRLEPARTVGIDTSESVIETARSLAKAKPARHLTFEVGNIYESRFPDESFDAIFAHHVLQHLRRRRAAAILGASDIRRGCRRS